MNQKAIGILLAGGSGSRMGAEVNKVLLPVGGIPCIIRSAMALLPFVNRLMLVCRPEDRDTLRAMMERFLPCGFPFDLVQGGSLRQDSVAAGLAAIPDCTPADTAILIHDGARCLVSPQIIEGVLSAVFEKGAGVAAIPVTGTLRAGDSSGAAGNTVPREGLFEMQTPQGFRLGHLRRAFAIAAEDHFTGTDDAAVMAHAGYPVWLTEGSPTNLKLTTPADLKIAEALLAASSDSGAASKEDRSVHTSVFPSFPPLRIGHGYDVHRLTEGRQLILCGVNIPHSLGLLGHSDADVALHALMDALLGAAGLGDIGRHFPDTDSRYEGIDSMKLLSSVMDKIRAAGWAPVNVDLTIVAQKPKLAPFIPRMAENLASALELPLSQVNVKATTTEHLGFEGRMEGISAQAVCMLQSFPAEIS